MSLRRFITALSVVALSGRASAATPGVLQIPFTNDAVVSLNDPGGQYGGPGQLTYAQAHNQAQMGWYGPDGPWQAVAVSLGGFATTSLDRNPYSGVWPILSDVTFLLGREAGGNYTTQSPKLPVGFRLDTSVYFTGASMVYDGQNLTDGTTLVAANASASQLTVHRLLGTSDYEGFDFTTDVVETVGWEVSLRNRTAYTPKTGLLGMKAVLNSFTGHWCGTTCSPEHLKNRDLIGSRTFSLHIGSTITGQQGSFALGGYEQTRVVGPVGVFDMMDDTPIVFLRDLFLGVESGFSPFHSTSNDNISVYTGQQFGSAQSASLNAKLRASPGSVVVTPNAAAPGIYLPQYLCEGLARHLPVTLDPSTGYYFWNTSSPLYSLLERSPAYLGFVLADRNARNITIKVPFMLLYLDLEPPLVSKTTKYFPCHGMDSDLGYWQLGRAFLQAAFFGYSLEQNVTYLAQAPGPDVEQSVVRAWRPEDVGVDSLPLDAWWKSWQNRLTGLQYPVDENGMPIRSGMGAMEGGTLGGVVAGSVVGFGLLLGLLWWGLRWRRGQGLKKGVGAELGGDGTDTKAVEMGEEKLCEKGEDVMRYEMGDMTTFELGTGTDVLISPLSPVSDGVGGQSVATAETVRTEPTEGTMETEKTVAEKASEGPDIFEMPGDEPLWRPERETEVEDVKKEETGSRKGKTPTEDGAGEGKHESQEEDRPKSGS